MIACLWRLEYFDPLHKAGHLLKHFPEYTTKSDLRDERGNVLFIVFIADNLINSLITNGSDYIYFYRMPYLKKTIFHNSDYKPDAKANIYLAVRF